MKFLINLIIFCLIAAGTALALNRQMIETGTEFTTRHYGSWVTWTAAARDDADPYTRAHFIRKGALPISTATARTYEARTDEAGDALRSSCDYAIEGTGPSAVWWSLAVYTSKGRLIDNPAHRYNFASDTVMRDPDNSYRIILARQARAGNWLPTMRSNRLSVVLRVHQPRYAALPGQEPDVESELPTIKKLDCR